jgi:hypothetical protein
MTPLPLFVLFRIIRSPPTGNLAENIDAQQIQIEPTERLR